MARVSAVVLAKNEQEAIACCVKSLTTFADQVVVVDSHSQDNTVRVAVDSGAEVVQFEWNGKYPKKKQWALDNANVRHDWTLLVDADERVSQNLAKEISTIVETDAFHAAFDIPVEYQWAGQLLKYGQTVVKRSLVRRSACRFPQIDDLAAPGGWEVEGHYQPIASGPIGRTRHKLTHADPDLLSDWFQRHNRYSDWEAFLRQNPAIREQVRANRTRQGQSFDRLPLKPVLIFLYNYAWKQGWRDGRAGLDYATALAYYQWQVSAKVREQRVKFGNKRHGASE